MATGRLAAKARAVLSLVAVTVGLVAALLVSSSMMIEPAGAQVERKTVYITFDDNPSFDGVVTDQVLDVLDKYDVKATFFSVGQLIERDPQTFQRIYQADHAIGNHTFSHPRLTDLSDSQVLFQIDSMQDSASRAGFGQLTCYRPPFGATDDRIRSLAASRGLSEVLWQTDGNDFLTPQPSVDAIVGNLLTAQDGDIIIMHDGWANRFNTPKALDKFIGQFGSQFNFEKVPSCDRARPAAVSAPITCWATKTGPNSGRITWTRANNDGASQFVIRRSRNGGQAFWNGRVSAGGPRSFNVSNLPANAEFRYQVEALGANGTRSTPRGCGGSIVTDGGVGSGPKAVASCWATGVGNSARVTWTRAGNDGAVSVVLYRRRDGGTAFWRARVSPTSPFVDANFGLRGSYSYLVETIAADGRRSVRKSCGGGYSNI